MSHHYLACVSTIDEIVNDDVKEKNRNEEEDEGIQTIFVQNTIKISAFVMKCGFSFFMSQPKVDLSVFESVCTMQQTVKYNP